jgi:hypothetical protein
VFQRQLVSNAFTDLRTSAITPQALYVVVGDALLTAALASGNRNSGQDSNTGSAVFHVAYSLFPCT